MHHCRQYFLWAVLLVSDNKLDGKTASFDSGWHSGRRREPVPPILFNTRQEARDYGTRHFQNRKRKDLAAEPHGWKPARVVKVEVSVETV